MPAESAIWKRRAAVAAVCEEQPRLKRIVAEVARAESHARLAARRFGEQVGTAGLARIVAITGPLDATDTLPDVLLPEGTGLRISSHSRGGTGIAITECLRRTTRCGRPSRLWRKGNVGKQRVDSPVNGTSATVFRLTDCP